MPCRHTAPFNRRRTACSPAPLYLCMAAAFFHSASATCRPALWPTPHLQSSVASRCALQLSPVPWSMPQYHPRHHAQEHLCTVHPLQAEAPLLSAACQMALWQQSGQIERLVARRSSQQQASMSGIWPRCSRLSRSWPRRGQECRPRPPLQVPLVQHSAAGSSSPWTSCCPRSGPSGWVLSRCIRVSEGEPYVNKRAMAKCIDCILTFYASTVDSVIVTMWDTRGSSCWALDCGYLKA
mmetsp:Transcript_37721/g.84038  ORF Transcript_37721/g.84038 Transcript_37721/m.84038 type:complete len:238 (+) Transcript_37721:880-1593(+)